MREITYRIYADESVGTGKYYSNFYGGALVNISDINRIENELNKKKQELNLNGEIKWTKITDNYLDKYIEMVNLFFKFIKNGKIKIRIMFAQNTFVTDSSSKEQTNNEYSILYYLFLKNAFGLNFSNDNSYKNKVNFSFYLDDLPCSEQQKNALKRSLLSCNFELRQNNIEIKEVEEIDSKKHVIQQCLDIVLGSMNFKLNDFDKIVNQETGKKSKRTRAKEKLYKVINKNIQDIKPGFNIGISTGIEGNQSNYWKQSYRHWNFKSSYSHYDKTLTKRGIKKNKK